MIKAKKQAASDAEVGIKKLDHEVQALAKEKAGHVTAATNLEKQDEWIAEEITNHRGYIHQRMPACHSCLGKRYRSMTLASLIWAS